MVVHLEDLAHTTYLLRMLYKYASPIHVGMDAIGEKSTVKWIQVLESTRNCLTQCVISDELTKPTLLSIANNIRNLYRLFNLDLSEKELWENIKEDTVWYGDQPNYMTFEELQADFDMDQSSNKQVFGHILYVLVATSDSLWKQNMQMYEQMPPTSYVLK